MSDGTSMTMKMADQETNRVMKNWMEIPEDLHYISQEFENDKYKWKTLKVLYSMYNVHSDIPAQVMRPVIEAFKIMQIGDQTKLIYSTQCTKFSCSKTLIEQERM